MAEHLFDGGSLMVWPRPDHVVWSDARSMGMMHACEGASLQVLPQCDGSYFHTAVARVSVKATPVEFHRLVHEQEPRWDVEAGWCAQCRTLFFRRMRYDDALRL